LIFFFTNIFIIIVSTVAILAQVAQKCHLPSAICPCAMSAMRHADRRLRDALDFARRNKFAELFAHFFSSPCTIAILSQSYMLLGDVEGIEECAHEIAKVCDMASFRAMLPDLDDDETNAATKLSALFVKCMSYVAVLDFSNRRFCSQSGAEFLDLLNDLFERTSTGVFTVSNVEYNLMLAHGHKAASLLLTFGTI